VDGLAQRVNALDNVPNDFESLGATLENAARLHKAGVTVALMTGDAHNARNLRQGAGNAVAYGMPWDAALAAVTSVPAKIWGIDGSYGTLEAGKDAEASSALKEIAEKHPTLSAQVDAQRAKLA
jgi:imidazolonepropionase-like amidohydrolase